MTAADFRKAALAVPGAIESSHMAHPDFRIRGKIFATLGYPDAMWAMVKLTPEQQQTLIRKAPKAFSPSAGAWGKSGCTKVLLTAASKPTVRSALLMAASNIQAKHPRPAGFNP
jgi:hypothetical protein